VALIKAGARLCETGFSGAGEKQKDPALKSAGSSIQKGSHSSLAVFIVEQVALNRHVQDFQSRSMKT
jgi:hypothetical protein